MRPSPYQTEELRKAYIIDAHPTREQREEIGKRIGMFVHTTLSSLSSLSHDSLLLGAIRVSRIGFKISEVLRKGDLMMTVHPITPITRPATCL